ncbi:MAG TPA: hypothetical protein PLQ54_04745 [Armatimonadota bacterium]|nr:hypothetical protein [Armatimonadota bacterium]
MGVMDRLAERWANRESGLEPIMHSQSILVRATAADVYAFLIDPESMRVIVADAANAFRVPGTPTGEIGEQVCVVIHHDTGHRVDLWETTDLIPEREIRQRLVSVDTPWEEHLTIEEYGPAAARLTDTHEGFVSLGRGAEVRAYLDSSVNASLDRIRVALEERSKGQR